MDENINKISEQTEELGESAEKADDVIKPIQIKAADDFEYAYKQEKLVSELMGLFQRWESWRRPYELIWEEIYNLYMNYQTTSKITTKSKIFVPVVFKIVENSVAKFISIILSQEEFFDVIPQNIKDMETAELIKSLLLFQLSKNNFFQKLVDFVKQLTLYGTSYFKVYWNVRRDWVWTREPIKQDMSIFGFTFGKKIVGWKETKEWKVIERRPEVEVIDILDVFPDPIAKNVKDGKGVFVRTWMSIHDVKRMGKGKYPVYANVDSPKLSESNRTLDPSRHMRATARGVNSTSGESKDFVEVIEFWGRYDLDEDGIDEECYIVIANREVLLKASANPFYHQKRPIVKCTFSQVPLEWYGVGLVEPIISLQHELNTLRRQRIDNINLILNRMWMVNSLSDVDIDTLVSMPNGIILTDDMNAVQAISTPDVTQSSYNDALIVQSDIEDVTIPRAATGTPQSGRLGRTAKGAQMIISQALEKFAVASKNIESAIQSVLRMFHQLNLQFIDSEDVAREIGMTGNIFDQVLTPDMIRADVGFKMVGISEMLGKEGKINQIISFYSLFKDVLSPQTIKALAEKIWTLMGFDKNDIKLITEAPPQQLPMQPPQGMEGLLGQLQQNGATAPLAVPGMEQPPQQ